MFGERLVNRDKVTADRQSKGGEAGKQQDKSWNTREEA